MKIVKFKDGRYGIRKGIIFYKFLDIQKYNYWWRRKEHIEIRAKGTLDEVKKALDIVTDNGVEVKDA